MLDEVNEIKKLLLEIMLCNDFILRIDMPMPDYEVFRKAYRIQHLIKWVEHGPNIGVWTVTDEGRAWLERHK